ncbi:MAG TPA: hypothetical protein DDW65_19090, partial [Firmicutes bacterium]|nr:hypothetical protein [Bacillota bacterium]
VIAPVNDARYAIGIDITQNHIGFALTDLSGNVLTHTRQYKPFVHERQYFIDLGELVMKFLSVSNISEEQFLGFGISIPGIVSSDNKKITFSHALGISDVPCNIFSQFIPYPCIFMNDANAAIIADLYRIPERYTTIYLSLSNSVGGAIYLGKSNDWERNQLIDNLYFGDNCRSGEFGHMTLIPGGKKCYCGKDGCLDAYCSAKNLSKLTDGNQEFTNIWEEYLSNLAIAINNLRMAFDCQVIIGGYVGSYIEPYISYLHEKAALLNTFESNALYIKPCCYKIEASALGAALRHIERFISTI